MPITRRTSSPARLSRSGRMRGMPPATAASKRRATPESRAAPNSSPPRLASSSLLAVTTGLPARRARRMRCRAGSMPPMVSTTRSMSGSVTTDSASWVSTPSANSTARSRERLCTATRVISSVTPCRAAISVDRSLTSDTRAAPTLPQPSSPMRTGPELMGPNGTGPLPHPSTPFPTAAGLQVEAEEVLVGLAADDEAGVAVVDEHDRRAEDLVVVRAHRVAVGAGDRGGEQVADGEVVGDVALAHQHVARLTVL